MWKQFKKYHFNPNEDIEKVKQEINQQTGNKTFSEIYMDVEVFLRRIMRLYGDTMPTKKGTNKDGKPVYVLPYETAKNTCMTNT